MSESSSTFRTDQPHLSSLLLQIHQGRIQLPDFQRGWVWDDEHIVSLLASVSLGYPIGAAMFLEVGGNGVRFKPRPVEGVELEPPVEPEVLILDGQQRFTSLYLALQSGKPVPTRVKRKRKNRLYYLDMAACLDPLRDRGEAVLSVPEEKVLLSDFGRQIDLDLRTREQEIQHKFFPLALVGNSAEYAAWRRQYGRTHRQDESALDLWDEFEEKVVRTFQQYMVPLIVLGKETPKEAVCQVFEKVNTGGVVLSVFELVTATFAADEYQLRQDWEERIARLKERPLLTDVSPTDFLMASTLLASYRKDGAAVSCKRKDILNLALDDYRACADDVESGLQRAARFLAREKVFDAWNLPYTTQLVPLSAICAQLGGRFEEEPIRRKLSQWYWCGVFGELYGGGNEARYANDLQDVLRWVDGGDEPRTVRDFSFSPTRLLSLQTRNSAAYKGVMAQLLQLGSADFLSGDPIELNQFFEERVEIHHIFPRAWCQKQRLSKVQWNSVVNKAPLAARTNRILSGDAPSVYLQRIERDKEMEPARLDSLLRSHLIQPKLLRKDDFEAFLQDRARRILERIETATGRSVSGRDSDEVVLAFGASLAPA